MLLGNLELLWSDPGWFFLRLLAGISALLVGITIHEFSHAILAHRLGDQTPYSNGRLSLNPLRHLDPAGTLMLVIAGFGWGKPVPVNPFALEGNPRTSMCVVALAGPLSNFGVAASIGFLFRIDIIPMQLALASGIVGTFASFIVTLALLMVVYNLILAIFNLLPLWPLDGFQVALGLLPEKLAWHFERLKPYGLPVILLAIMGDMVFNLGIRNLVLGTPLDFLVRFLLP